MNTSPDHPHAPTRCRIVAIPGGAAPSFTLADAQPVADELHAAREAAWARLCADNPRLHDGPILRVDPAELLAGRLMARRDGYKALATAALTPVEIRNDICALGIQALVTAPDSAGRPCVLVARRASTTRIYGGLWENAPSGTVAPPPRSSVATTIGPAELLAALRQEAQEELGLNMSVCSPRFLAWLHDPAARTLDLVVNCSLPATTLLPCPAAANWEYLAAAWVPIADLDSWFTASAHAFSPPTVALFMHQGWLRAAPTNTTIPATNPLEAERCPACGHAVSLVHVHGHAQCAVCGCNVAPCCQPEQS